MSHGIISSDPLIVRHFEADHLAVLVADDALRGDEPLELDPLVLRLVQFEFFHGGFGGGAAVEHLHRLRAEADGGTAAIHRREAEAEDDDVLADARRLLPVRDVQVFEPGQAVLDAVQFLAGDAPCAADFVLYPYLGYVWRIGVRKPETKMDEIMPAPMAQYKKRVEALPFFDKTFPPHWR